MARKVKRVGLLTAGGDCPGLNAVIRAIAKSLSPQGVRIVGFLEGFRGLVDNRHITVKDEATSGLLIRGGTILGTSRDKPHRMPQEDGSTKDVTDAAIATYRKLNLDCLICLGGGGTQKNAHRLQEQGGLNVITAPKTIDNDVPGTDICFGFDTGMHVATEAIDRLHTTASSHHRVIVVETMGHNAGWLALGSGVAGGADVILIPEIPYSLDIVSESLLRRMRAGKMFSIVAIAEGAASLDEIDSIREAKRSWKEGGKEGKFDAVKPARELVCAILAEHIEDATGLETRITSLGHVQRGGIPTPTDRLLSTIYGTMAAECALRREFGVMVAKRGPGYEAVPLEDVVGNRKTVPPDHPWLSAARAVNTCMGDEIPEAYRD